jgi:predicted permease
MFALVLVALGLLLARLSGRLARTDRPSQVALDLTSMFSNTANLGLPLVALMLSPQSLAAAVLFVVTQVVLVNTVGAYVASSATVPARAAIRRIVRLPAPWAAVAAGCVQLFHVHLPAVLLAIAHEGAQAYAPTVLAVLGLSIGDVTLRMVRNRVTWLGTVIRLLAMPGAAFAVARLLGLTTEAVQALVLQIGMPVAVNAILLAQEFGANPEAVAESIALTSIVGILTIPILAALLLRM